MEGNKMGPGYFRVSMPRVWHEYVSVGGIYHRERSGGRGKWGCACVRPILLFWEDGRIVWSDDPSGGAPPYWRGGVDEDRVPRLLDNLEAHGAFRSPIRNWCFAGFGEHPFVISIAAGSRRLRMASDCRAPVPRELSGNELDLQFCQLWSDLEGALMSLRPGIGERLAKAEFEIDWLPWRQGCATASAAMAPPNRGR